MDLKKLFDNRLLMQGHYFKVVRILKTKGITFNSFDEVVGCFKFGV